MLSLVVFSLPDCYPPTISTIRIWRLLPPSASSIVRRRHRWRRGRRQFWRIDELASVLAKGIMYCVVVFSFQICCIV